MPDEQIDNVPGFLPAYTAVLAAINPPGYSITVDQQARRATMAAMWTARPYIIAEAFADMADNLRDINEHSTALVLDAISAELRKALNEGSPTTPLPEPEENPT